MVRTSSPPDSPKGPGGVTCALALPEEPEPKGAISFIDDQNPFGGA